MSADARGLIAPFRRDRKRDLASGTGVELLRSKIEQVLMTQGETAHSAGELSWRTDFGSGLHMLRHRKNSAVLGELARVYVRDALRKWVPEVEVVGVVAESRGAALICKVRFRVAGQRGGVGEFNEAVVRLL